MRSAIPVRFCVVLVFAALMAMAPALRAGSITAQQQTGLVQKYCAVRHTDAARNGGLSLEHYNAAEPDPALATMLLSKLRNGAMGAAGLSLPDKETQDAWIAATAAQATQAKSWSVTSWGAPAGAEGSESSLVQASIVRDVAPRKPGEDSPLYRLSLTCDTSTHQGEIHLTWSPEPQLNRTFSVSVDGRPGIPQRLESGAEHMGNSTSGTSGGASAVLTAPLANQTLAIGGVFPGETVVFPLGDLNGAARQQLAICFAATPNK